MGERINAGTRRANLPPSTAAPGDCPPHCDELPGQPVAPGATDSVAGAVHGREGAAAIALASPDAHALPPAASTRSTQSCHAGHCSDFAVTARARQQISDQQKAGLQMAFQQVQQKLIEVERMLQTQHRIAPDRHFAPQSMPPSSPAESAAVLPDTDDLPTGATGLTAPAAWAVDDIYAQSGPTGPDHTPLRDDELLLAMPQQTSEKVSAFFKRASQAIRNFLTPAAGEGDLIEERQATGLQSLYGAVAAGKGAVQVAALMQEPLVDEAGSVVGVSALPLALLGAGLATVEMADSKAEQPQAWRELLRNFHGAKRYFDRIEGGDAAAPIEKGDAECFYCFLRHLDKLPQFSKQASRKNQQAALGFAQQVGASLADSALDDAVNIGNSVQALTPVVCGVLIAAGGAAEIVSGGLEIAEGVSRIEQTTHARSALEEKQLAVLTQVSQYKSSLEEGWRQMAATIKSALARHQAGAIEEVEHDRRLAIAKVTKGGIAVLLGIGLVSVGIVAAVGLALPPIGIVIAVASAVVSVAYVACVVGRAHGRGQYLVESDFKQYQASRRLHGASLAQMSALFLRELEQHVDIGDGHSRARLDIDKQDLENNLYFSLHFMARALTDRVERNQSGEDGAAMAGDDFSSAAVGEPFEMDAPRASRALERQKFERMELEQMSARDRARRKRDLKSQNVAPLSATDIATVDALIDELLFSCGMTKLALGALERMGQDAAPEKRMDLFVKQLAFVLDLQFVDQTQPLAHARTMTAAAA